MATDIKTMTKAQRKALTAKVAKDKAAGMSGAALRDKYGAWLTGPVRRQLLREFGHDSLVGASYDRQEAKAKREALQAQLASASKAKAKRAPRKARPAQAAPQPAASPASVE